MSSSENVNDSINVSAESKEDHQLNCLIKAIDDGIDNLNIDTIKSLISNFNSNSYNKTQKDIVLEIFNKDMLTNKRLKFIIENLNEYLYISSSLIRSLIKLENKNCFEERNNFLHIIFDKFRIYDDEFIKFLLYQYKNKISQSLTEFNKQISNKKYKISYSFNYYLNSACKSKNEDMVKFLIIHGANINGDNKSQAPLFDAWEEGNENIIKYLIKHGADINTKNMYGETPLIISCYENNEKNGKILN